MVTYENECMGCDTLCIGNGCSYLVVPHFFCDECGEEEQIYDYEGQELCLSCIEKQLIKIN